MSTPLDDLIDLLDLEEIEANIFRGRSPSDWRQRVFGGQVAGQALVAAGRTVPADRPVHSLHAYFIRPGDPSVPFHHPEPGVQHAVAMPAAPPADELSQPEHEFFTANPFDLRFVGPTRDAPGPRRCEVLGPTLLVHVIHPRLDRRVSARLRHFGDPRRHRVQVDVGTRRQKRGFIEDGDTLEPPLEKRAPRLLASTKLQLLVK